jgi:aryl sulfotransferase
VTTIETSSSAWPTKTRDLQTAIFDSTRWNDFKYRDDDIIIVTWGKSGTTWMQQIVSQLVLGAPEGVEGLHDSPWLDMRIFPLDEVLALLEAQTHRRFIKTHLPVDAIGLSSRTKYIYVGRDTRDIVWSAYNHHASFTPQALAMFNNTPGLVGPPLEPPPCEIHDYYLRFLETGEMPGFPLSPFWGHVRDWWAAARLPNVLLVHFNDLKNDLEREARRVADFLEIDVGESLWPAIVEHCGFDYMQREMAKVEQLDQIFTGGGKTFVFKGTNGRWKDVLSAEEIARCDEVAARELTPDCADWLRTGRGSNALRSSVLFQDDLISPISQAWDSAT